MYKPDSLRAHLTAALPALQSEPHRLVVRMARGRLKSTASGSLSWRYDYTLQLHISAWAGPAAAVFAPLLVWLQEHQWDLLSHNDRDGIRFEAQYLAPDTQDLLIELDLSEAVLVRERSGSPGALELHHPQDAPGPLDLPMREHWSFWLRDEKLAEWDYAPRRPLPAPPDSL